MSTLTSFLGLPKPTDSDFQDASVIGQALQAIDDYLEASVKFTPIPLGNSSTDAANYNTPFGYVPAYADMGDHLLVRGVIARVNTATFMASGDIIGRIPVSLPASQYYFAAGAGGVTMNLQINTTGQISVRAAPTGNTYWCSLDNIPRIWKV